MLLITATVLTHLFYIAIYKILFLNISKFYTLTMILSPFLFEIVIFYFPQADKVIIDFLVYASHLIIIRLYYFIFMILMNKFMA